jgi:Fe-S cluster assembly protein SufD
MTATQGEANQLHKCIVTAASGRGVFDGNVRVGKLAQRTDAGQLSRNLLLAPRATVNVKPNLQVIFANPTRARGCILFYR